MNKNLITFVGIVLVLSFFACKETNTDPPDPKPVLPIGDSLEVIRKATQTELGVVIPSVSVYIDSPKGTYFATSNEPGETPVTPKTIFRFASNTKNFTATAILNMYEDGWLDIYDTITGLIPGTDIPYVPATDAWNIPYKSEITIEQLLQHSAGVYDVDNDSVPNCGGESYVEYTFINNPAHQFSAEELVNQIAINGLSYWEPGYSHHYSNTGYTILSEIIARVYSAKKTAGKTYKDYLFDYIYGPHSKVPLDLYFPDQATDVAINELHATGVIYYPEPRGTVHYDPSNMSAHVAEGNGYANFTELNKYIRSLMKAQNVLEAETVTLMQTDFSPDVNGTGNYALGCIRTTNLGFGHNGCIRGYLSIMMYDPSVDVSVIVMMNAVDYLSEEDFLKNFTSMYDCVWKAREILGYPGKPAK